MRFSVAAIVFGCWLGLATSFAHAGNSYSGLPWGYGYCCVVGMCGTIPCDDQCAGKAFENFGNDVADAEGDLRDAYIDLMDATNGTTRAVIKMSADVVYQYSVFEGDFLNGLDASTKIRQGEEEKSRALMERLADHEMQTVRNLMASKTAAEAAIYNEAAFKPKTDVGMLEESAKNIGEISKIFWTTGSIFKQVYGTITEFQKEYTKNLESGAGMATRAKTVALTKDAKIVYREPGGISKEAFQKNTYPSLVAYDAIHRKSINLSDKLLNKIDVAKNDVRTFQLAELVSGDVQSPVKIPSIYSQADLVSPDGTSLNQYLGEDTLTQEKWFQAVKLMSENDLKREMLMQDARAAAIELSMDRLQQSAGLRYATRQ